MTPGTVNELRAIKLMWTAETIPKPVNDVHFRTHSLQRAIRQRGELAHGQERCPPSIRMQRNPPRAGLHQVALGEIREQPNLMPFSQGPLCQLVADPPLPIAAIDVLGNVGDLHGLTFGSASVETF